MGNAAHILAAIVLAASACKKPNANEWALERYGSVGETLRHDTENMFALAEGVAGGLNPSATAALPRPYLVFKVAYGPDTNRLDFHRINKALDPSPPIASVRGVAVVRYVTDFTYQGTVRVRGGGHVVQGTYKDMMLVTLIDRETKAARKIAVTGQEDADLTAALEGLPSAP